MTSNRHKITVDLTKDDFKIKNKRKIIQVDLTNDDEIIIIDDSPPKKQRKSIPTTKSTSPPKPKSISPPKPTSPQKPPPSFAGFKCAICLDVPEVQNMSSTKCGHIYCTACIDACYQRDKSCPICRKKITKGSIFRLYV